MEYWLPAFKKNLYKDMDPSESSTQEAEASWLGLNPSSPSACSVTKGKILSVFSAQLSHP